MGGDKSRKKSTRRGSPALVVKRPALTSGIVCSVRPLAPEEVAYGSHRLADSPLVARRDAAPGGGWADDSGLLGGDWCRVPPLRPAVGSGPQPLRALARGPALGDPRRASPRPGPEVLLRERHLPAADLRRTARRRRPALRPAHRSPAGVADHHRLCARGRGRSAVGGQARDADQPGHPAPTYPP